MTPDTFAITPRVETALRLMLDAHAGQADKCGQPYVLHCLRVGVACVPDEDAMIVGFLHDVLEDAPQLEERLYREMGADIYTVVRDLTRRPDETYLQYIRNLKINGSPVSITVKLADLYDNLDIRRLQLAAENGHDVARLVRKYTRALAILTDSQKLF